MYLIAGLGNPEEKYRGTRHNIGFEVLDALADRLDIRVTSDKCRALVGKGYICGEKVLLAKPLTYMNNSGESIAALVDYYKLDAKKDLIVIYDDIALPVEKLRIRPEGSAGGHNGIKSIIARLGTLKFDRIRVGVGDKPEGRDLVDHVLGRFSSEDRVKIEETIIRACDALETIITDGVDTAMNRFN